MSTSHTSLLPKGAACTNCRHRKIRCDGQKPTCSPCLNSQTYNDCEYNRTLGIAGTQSLENQISALEARLKEHESRQTTISQTKVYLYAAPSSVQLSPSKLEDIPPMLSQLLMHNFIHKRCSLGFFLDKESFEKSVLHNEGEKPILALLTTSYLWGMHLSSSAIHPEQENMLVSRALESSTDALSGNHPQKVLQCIQSEVLLANYFYRAGRSLQGKHHANVAASFVLSSGMYKIRSSYSEVSGYCATFRANQLAAPRDAMEEGERINAFWTVLTLDAFWSTAHDVPSSILYNTTAMRVDTPWPRRLEDYTRAPFGPEFRSSHTIERFLSGVLDNGIPSRITSSLANFARGAILFERATFIGLQLQNNPYSKQSQAKFISLDTLIQKFIADLSLSSTSSGTSMDHQLCMFSLAHAADIQLHLPFASQNGTSRNRIFTAAKAIVQFIDTLGNHVSNLEYINPMLAVIWTIASKVFMNPTIQMQYVDSGVLCERVMAAMERHTFPLMKDQLSQVKQKLASNSPASHAYRT